MCASIVNRDIKTRGYVLRRTDYGEADRIINLITPLGKFSAIAKGVRRPKSKLAGGIEMFTLSDYNLHQGKSDFAIVTGVKMVRYYGEILKDFDRMQLAGAILKRVSAAADSADTGEYFRIVDECLNGLEVGSDIRLVESWFWLNLVRAMGEEINLYRDTTGKKLMADGVYQWDEMEMAFLPKENGDFGANEIKMLRLMLTADFEVINRVKIDHDLLEKVHYVAQTVARV